jgi:uncharacterized coiled-coil DUF342 family protein
MSWSRRRARVREPHPDPSIELRLQAIVALQSQRAAYARLTEDYRYEIGELHAQARELRTSYQIGHQAPAADRRADVLHDKILGLQDEIRNVSQEIAEAASSLSESDMSYLLPR